MSTEDVSAPKLRRCGRCSCGLTTAASVCDYCGAVLTPIAIAGKEVFAVVCLSCGHQNPVAAENCAKCNRELLQVCPNCESTISCVSSNCAYCGALRSDFYTICARQASVDEQQNRKSRRIARIIPPVVGAAFVGLFLALSLVSVAIHDVWLAKAWLIPAGVCAIFSLMLWLKP
jgi:ribosomal protein L40E